MSCLQECATPSDAILGHEGAGRMSSAKGILKRFLAPIIPLRLLGKKPMVWTLPCTQSHPML